MRRTAEGGRGVRQGTGGPGAVGADAHGWEDRPAGTPGQLRAEALARGHALAVLVDEVAQTGRELAGCREDPSWTGRAHDAFARSLDDLVGRVALAATLLHDARSAAGSVPGCAGGRP
jgi:hypothetical protein